MDQIFERVIKNTIITIIALGPLTNIAEIITKHSKNIEKIIISGGVKASMGKKTEFDFNLRCNKEATFKVLTSDLPIVLIPSSIYSQIYILKSDLKRLNLYRNQPHIDLIQRLLKRKVLKFLDKKICLPDLLSVAVAINPYLISVKRGYFKETKLGHLEFRESKSGNVEIATGVDTENVWDLFYETVINLKK